MRKLSFLIKHDSKNNYFSNNNVQGMSKVSIVKYNIKK